MHLFEGAMVSWHAVIPFLFVETVEAAGHAALAVASHHDGFRMQGDPSGRAHARGYRLQRSVEADRGGSNLNGEGEDAASGTPDAAGVRAYSML
ncbi:hypothetical protein [Streptomyces sp. NPDC090445]|uniref:hypothetical protein n=1 Tax=Streptomyces sp. NPDC090445 TaxID=3365963 RepID=UPI0038236D44